MQISKAIRFGLLGIVSLALAACSSAADPSPSASETGAEPSASASASASPSPSATILEPTEVPGVTVTAGAKEGDAPVISMETPWEAKETTVEVLKEGTSDQVVGNGFVEVNYVGVNGRTGEVFDESFSTQPLTMTMPDGAITGFAKAVVGRTVGSRVLVGIPSEEAYPDGQGDAIKAGDSLVFVIDILSATYSDITGTMTQAGSDLPQVTMTDDGPTVEVPAAVADLTKTESSYLIEGDGVKVTEADYLSIRYRSFTADGEVFEDAWAEAQVGALTNTIDGFTSGLVGKKTGSRILITIPASEAYPDGRTSSEPTLAPGQTLIYVIDLYYAASS